MTTLAHGKGPKRRCKGKGLSCGWTGAKKNPATNATDDPESHNKTETPDLEDVYAKAVVQQVERFKDFAVARPIKPTKNNLRAKLDEKKTVENPVEDQVYTGAKEKEDETQRTTEVLGAFSTNRPVIKTGFLQKPNLGTNRNCVKITWTQKGRWNNSDISKIFKPFLTVQCLICK